MNSFYRRQKWIEENFVEIRESAEVVLDLKYSTLDNFMKTDVYGGFSRCFLSPLAANMFAETCKDLRRRHSHLQFHVWDALRPRSVQARFYDHLKDTPFRDYVAAPHPGSLHNFGMALDLTLQTRDGRLLDMGTDFDHFGDLSQPKLEKQFLASGTLTPLQLENRLLLRSLLEGQGFTVLEHEWWHFNALAKDQVYGKHVILE